MNCEECYLTRAGGDGVTKREAIIFDIDGTLLQSEASDDALYLTVVRELLGNVTLRPSSGMYTEFTAAGILAEIFDDNAIGITPANVSAVRDCFVAHISRHVNARGPFAEVSGARAVVARYTSRPLIALPPRREVATKRRT